MNMNATIEQFRQLVREYAQTEIAPLASKIDRDNEFPTQLWKSLGQA